MFEPSKKKKKKKVMYNSIHLYKQTNHKISILLIKIAKYRSWTCLECLDQLQFLSILEETYLPRVYTKFSTQKWNKKHGLKERFTGNYIF